ncbi:Lrp/AsnC family transcriptional regulator [Candidatus Bathyarchaeota archaeon A05DMB-4]|nr:Lrp/AsnC family transcriptional regulator [Candidatus Bathyarchaeota archaeon A05DMB-4]
MGKAMKDVELMLVSELMKDCRRSDGELAKALGISRVAVRRLIKKLNEEKYINEYAAIPNFTKLGFGVLVVTLIKCEKNLSLDEYERVIDAGEKLDEEIGLPVVTVVKGVGSDYDLLLVSVHKDFSDYREMIVKLRQLPCFGKASVETFVANLVNTRRICPLAFSSLARYMGKLVLEK